VADGAADLCHLHGVGQARAVEVVLTGEENLGLGLKFSKCMGVDDAVAVHLENAAVIALSRTIVGGGVEAGVETIGHACGRGVEAWSQLAEAPGGRRVGARSGDAELHADAQGVAFRAKRMPWLTSWLTGRWMKPVKSRASCFKKYVSS
jgi:hypothetical protein